MNWVEKALERRKLINLMRSPRTLKGFYSNNGIPHETVKLQIALILSKQGFEVYPECEFKNGSRSDLVAIRGHIGYCIEILDSEKESSCNQKVKAYPSDLTLVKVKVNDFNYKEWCI